MELEQLLRETDHKSYPAYKRLKGRYKFDDHVLSIDHVQGDPFAAPSSVSLHISAGKHGFPKEYYDRPHRRIMLQDYLLRRFGNELRKYDRMAGGSGKSGTMSVSHPHQEVLERTAVQIDKDTGMLTVRLQIGFPAAGRTTLSMELRKMLMEYLPKASFQTLFFQRTPKEELTKWIGLSDDIKALRDQLPERGLVAFVANGSILPRRSGVDDRPMKEAVKFISPLEDEVTLDLPNGRKITGMGIKKGITLIVGGGYHGKSTLLKALERGVYDHIPGDGREMVITDDSAMKLRAEDGRSIMKTDISMFIRNLPSKKDTACFSTEDASGSTSQAASTVEALISGSKTLLIDEDTSATNFCVRDELMQKVVLRDKEPIIPFLYRMRQLYETLGVSTILVAGSSGAFFGSSDTIIQMDEYNPLDITKRAKEEAKKEGMAGINPPDALKEVKDIRVPLPSGEKNTGRHNKVKGQGVNSVSLGYESIEIRFVEQVTDPEQTNMLGIMLRYLEENIFNGRETIPECMERLSGLIKEGGIRSLFKDRDIPGNLAMVRPLELYAMICRYRGLKLK
ncbi:MAG: ABC-ATPase domain-containing protein [Lachnospiraceae bacterium]|nr:ABC-ATPase domain-containing protein [Lachnospiraceae bacterium]